MKLIRGFFDGLKPEPVLKVSEWSDAHRYLAPESTAEPGRWRTDRAPYLREILDRLSTFDPTQILVVMKGAQLGLTEAAMNFVGYCIDNSPAPILYVMPTVEISKKASRTRIDPMIAATPRLRGKVKDPKSRDKGNTTLSKNFPGGTLTMAGANSAAGLRSMPIRNLILDEVDAYPIDLDQEGSPIDLAKARTRTFAKRKIFMLSTPTTESLSVIEKEFLSTAQRKYFVPCPHCGSMQFLEFPLLKWPEGSNAETLKPEDVKYECRDCRELIEERFKTSMLQHGKWIETVPEKANYIKYGYFINSLYSPYGWYSWYEAAKDFLEAQGNQEKLKTFTNTVLGETWKDSGEKPEWEMLFNKRESYSTNKPCKEVAFLTAGVDVQRDRLEVEIVGWGRNKKSWSIDYRVIVGNTNEKEVWDELAKVVNESWEREDKIVMPIHLMCVDSGYNTSEVYTFCRRFDETRVVPIKGQDSQNTITSPRKLIDCTIHGQKVGKIGLVSIGVSVVKSELYGNLKLQKAEDGTTPQGYCYFPEYNGNYFRGLCAEQLEFKLKDGFRRYMWVKKYERNEPLDCRVYARAAAAITGIDRFKDEHFDAIEQNYGYGDQENKQPKKPSAKKSSFW